MSLLRLRHWILLVLVSGLLSACSGGLPCNQGAVTQPEPPAEPITDTTSPTRSELPEVAPEPIRPPDFRINMDGTRIALDPSGNPINATAYFAYDEAELSQADLRMLSQHAGALVRNRSQSVTVEGHCDERGTREYNLALGERRAIAVQNFFLANGVRPNQMRTVSFGEEQPIDNAASEAAYAINRRVELRYN